MARTAPSSAARLQRLEAALVKARELKRGTILSAEPMRKLLGVSWLTLRQWCDEIPALTESGAVVRGDNGLKYEFKPVATIRCLIAYFSAQHKAKVEKALKIRRTIAGDKLDELPDDFDLDQIDKVIRVSSRLREERQAAGELVEAAKVGQALKTMMTEMQQAGVKAASQQDPTGQWPAEIREKFEDAVNNVLVVMARAGEKALSQLRGGTA